MGQLGPPNKEPNLGLQKSALWRHMAAKTPPKMEPNLGFKMTIYRVQVGTHLGTLVGGQDAKLKKTWVGGGRGRASMKHGSWDFLNDQFQRNQHHNLQDNKTIQHAMRGKRGGGFFGSFLDFKA